MPRDCTFHLHKRLVSLLVLKLLSPLKAFSITFSVVPQCILPGDLHELGKDNQSHSERNKITCDDQCALIVTCC